MSDEHGSLPGAGFGQRAKDGADVRVFRFRRALTTGEVDRVRDAVVRAGEEGGGAGGGAHAGLVALWDVILGEAEGLSWQEAVEAGVKFHPGDYVIPFGQALEIQEVLRRSDGRGESKAPSMLWFDLGPGTYDDAPGEEAGGGVV